MSNAVFPALPGLIYPVTKTPMWRTKVQESTSGKETRIGYWSYPRWKYEIGFDVLRSGALTELQQLAGFFNARNGSFDSWLFDDPDDNAVVDQSLGVADGVQTTFQLARALGGYVEPVLAPKADAIVYSGGTFGYLRENRLLYSQAFSNALWNKNNLTVSTSAVADPTGNTNASKLTRSATGNSYVVQGVVLPDISNRTFTFSVFVHGGGSMDGQAVILRLRNGAGTVEGNATINLTGAWQRASVTFTIPAGSGINLAVFVDPAVDTGTVGEFFLVWGAQLEEGGQSVGYLGTTSIAYTYTISSTGIVTYSFPPAYTAPMKWTGGYYWRCRFLDDQIDLTKFMRDLWELRSLQFQSLK